MVLLSLWDMSFLEERKSNMTANTKKNVVSFFQTAFFVDVVGTSISNFKRSALFAGLFDLHFAFQKAVFL